MRSTRRPSRPAANAAEFRTFGLVGQLRLPGHYVAPAPGQSGLIDPSSSSSFSRSNAATPPITARPRRIGSRPMPPPSSTTGTAAGAAAGGGGSGGGWSTTGRTQPGAAACAALTAAAPAAQMAVADGDLDKALSAAHELIEGVGTVAAAAAVEVKHNAQARSAPTICLGSLEDSIGATFLST